MGKNVRLSLFFMYKNYVSILMISFKSYVSTESRIHIFMKILILALMSGLTSILSIKAENLHFQEVHFPSVNGMNPVNPTVKAIYKDSKKYIWFGTEKELIRFDGFHTLVFPLPGEASRAGGITSISEIPGSNLIIGSGNGLYKFPGNEKDKNLEQIFSDEIKHVSSILRLDNGNMLVGTDKGIKMLDKDLSSVKNIALASGVHDESGHILAMSRLYDKIYLITKGGLYMLHINSLETRCLAEHDNADVDRTSIVATPDKIYIGTMGRGIIPYNMEKGHCEPPLRLPAAVVTNLAVDKTYSTLYVGTDGNGVLKVSLPDEKLKERYSYKLNDPFSPHNNQVYTLMLDEGNMIWIGYYQNGADYAFGNFRAFSIFDDDKYINSRGMAVRAMDVLGKQVALGTREGLIFMDMNKGTSSRFFATDLRSDMVLSLLRTPEKLYIGTYGGGMSMLDVATMKISSFLGNGDVTFTNGHIFSIARQDDHNIWVGTNTGAYHFNDGKLVNHYTSGNSRLPKGNVYEIFFDSHGKGWICTETGVIIYDPVKNALRDDIFPAQFPNDIRIHTIYEDSKGRLYFLPETGGSFRTNSDMTEIERFDPSNRPEIEKKSIIEDNRGKIWLATNRGVYCFSENDGWKHYGYSAGIHSPMFLKCHPAIDSDGNILFGNSEGMLKCDVAKLNNCPSEDKSIFPVAVRADGTTILLNDADKIDLKKHYTSITIDFSTFSYSLDYPEEYEYKIDRGDWHTLASDFSANLYNISGGNHTLYIRHKDKPDSTTAIKVSMPYSWFVKMMFILVTCVLVMGVYIIWLLRHLKRKRRIALEKAQAEENHPDQDETASESKKKYYSTPVSEKKCIEIAAIIDNVMREHKPFVDPDMKIADLAKLANVSSHKLSYVFSQHLNITFYDYINRFRVEEFKNIVKEKGVDSLTLSALAEQAGFSSRASFFRYFKKIENISPGEYIKIIKN